MFAPLKCPTRINVETNPTVLRDYGMTESSAGFALDNRRIFCWISYVAMSVKRRILLFSNEFVCRFHSLWVLLVFCMVCAYITVYCFNVKVIIFIRYLFSYFSFRSARLMFFMYFCCGILTCTYPASRAIFIILMTAVYCIASNSASYSRYLSFPFPFSGAPWLTEIKVFRNNEVKVSAHSRISPLVRREEARSGTKTVSRWSGEK